VRRRGLWRLHRAARVPGRPRPGLRTARPLQLPADAGRRHHADLPAGCRAGGRPTRLGDPLRRDRIQRTTLVRLGMAAHPLTPPPSPPGERAFHYRSLPTTQPAPPPRPIRAAGLRWPCEEDFEFGKDCFGLDQSQVRLYTAIARHTVLVMAALAVCAVTAALL